MRTCAINLRAGHGWGQKDQVKLTRRHTIAEGAAGQSPVVRFDRHAVRDKLGRFGHLTGLAWFGLASFTTEDGAMPSAMPGQLAYTLISGLSIQAGGREFLVQIDGADLEDDMIIREGVALAARPQDLADADATPTRSIQLIWTFGRPNCDERNGARVLDCAIPLSLFNANSDAEAGLRFVIEDAPTSGGGETADFPGVTSTGFVTAADPLEVYSILRYEDELHVDVPWQLRRVSGPELSGRYVSGALIHYLAVRDRVNTAGSWTPNHADYSTVEVTAGDERVLSGIDGATAVTISREANVLTVLSDDPLATPRLVTDTAPGYLFMIVPVLGARRVTLANGDVSWNIGARTAHLRTRVLMRGYGDYDPSFEAKARACTPGLGAADDLREVSTASPSPKAAGPVSQVLPVAIAPNPKKG